MMLALKAGDKRSIFRLQAIVMLGANPAAGCGDLVICRHFTYF